MSNPPIHLESDARLFYRAGPDLRALRDWPRTDVKVLDQLGPSPFPRSGFPFLGFLASVYDHVESHVARPPEPPTPPTGGS